MRTRHMLLLAITAALASCGDGGSGPAPTAEIAGSWAFEAHDMTAPGAMGKCGMTGRLELQQEGSVVSGSYTIDQITCSGPSGGTQEGPYYGEVMNGTVTGNQVHFHFDSEDLDQHGTVAGNRMSGSCTWRAEADGYVTITGRWSATRS